MGEQMVSRPARGILVSYPGYPFTPSSLMPDNGLANLAGSLKREGHEALVFDFGTVETIRLLYPEAISRQIKPVYRKLSEGRKPSFSDKAKILHLNDRLQRHKKKQVFEIARDIENAVRRFRANFVGLKLWNGDGFSGSFTIAKHLKRAMPKLRIFAGGPHADLFKEMILEKAGFIDALSYGDGEEAIVRLAEHSTGERAGLAEIPNVIYRESSNEIRINSKQEIQSLDSLAEPAYDEETYPSMERDQKIKIVTLDESRGCPFGCFFCAQPVKSGHFTREKSSTRIAREIERLARKYGISAFRYAGSSTPGKLMTGVAELLIERRIKVKYTSFAEANLLNDLKEMEFLRDSGLVSLFFGMESGSQEMLDRIHKCLNLEVLKKALKNSRRAGIFTVGSLIYPLPGETAGTREETIRFLREVEPDSVPVQFAGLYPGTPWFSNPEKYGFQVDREKYAGRVMDYKIKLLFPPTMWKDPGYRIDGMKFREFAGQTMAMIKELEETGIMTGISDDQFLMSLLSGKKPKEFRDMVREYFFTGDYEKISELVKEINRGIRQIQSPRNSR